MVRRYLVAIVTTVGMAMQVSAQEAPRVKVQPIARMQTQFNTTSVDEQTLISSRGFAALPATQFEMRRLRLGAEVSYDDWLTGKLEIEAAMGRLAMRDVYVSMEFAPELEVRAGQFKKPFSLLQLTSETVWPIIERGVRIRGLSDALQVADSVAGNRVLSKFQGATLPGEEQEILELLAYQSYDLGASINGKVGQFGYSLGFFNGPGADRADDNSAKSVAARATYRLPIALPLTIGAAVSRRDFRVASKPQILDDEGTAVEIDVELGAFRRPGFRALGEVAKGRNLGVPEDFLGAQVIVSFFKPVSSKRVEGVEFAGRLSYGDPRRGIDEDEATLLTPGLNVYFPGRNRLMFNWDYYRPSGDRFEAQNALRIQAQLYY